MGVILRLELCFILLVGFTTYLINVLGFSDIQVLVSHIISVGILLLLLLRGCIRNTEDNIKLFSERPYFSGVLVGGGLLVVMNAFDAGNYTRFTDYTLELLILPIFAYFMVISLLSFVKGVDEKIENTAELFLVHRFETGTNKHNLSLIKGGKATTFHYDKWKNAVDAAQNIAETLNIDEILVDHPEAIHKTYPIKKISQLEE